MEKTIRDIWITSVFSELHETLDLGLRELVSIVSRYLKLSTIAGMEFAPVDRVGVFDIGDFRKFGFFPSDTFNVAFYIPLLYPISSLARVFKNCCISNLLSSIFNKSVINISKSYLEIFFQ